MTTAPIPAEAVAAASDVLQNWEPTFETPSDVAVRVIQAALPHLTTRGLEAETALYRIWNEIGLGHQLGDKVTGFDIWQEVSERLPAWIKDDPDLEPTP